MAAQEFINLGPIYTTTEKFNALKAAGQLEVGREYKIVDWEAQEKLIAGTNIVISEEDGKTISAPNNAYNSIKQVADYLFEVQYSTENVDYDYANKYFKSLTNDIQLNGMCTGVHNNSKVLRQLDWYYDNNVEFIVRRPKDELKGFHASIGIASGIRGLTKEVVESGAYDRKFKMVPFIMTDGINDAGLYLQSNVVPALESGFDINPDAEEQCCISMAIRYMLDHCASFADVETFFNTVHIYQSPAFTFGCHFLVAIGDEWEIIELTADGHKTVTSGTGENQMPHGIISNFRTTGLTFTGDLVDWSSIETYGLGVERYDTATKVFTEGKTFEQLRADLVYTQLYTNTQANTRWNTDFAGEDDGTGYKLTVMDAKNEPSKYDSTFAKWAVIYSNRSRYALNPDTWQTTHSAIYDLTAKKFSVAIQERNTETYEFKLVEEVDLSNYVNLSSNQDIYGDKVFHSPVMYSNGLNATKLDDKKIVTVGAMSPEVTYNLPSGVGEYTLATQEKLAEDLALKQDNIDDLADIRDGAALGATSLQAADKTELESKISTETSNRETADSALDERLKKFELPAEPELKVISNNNYLFANGVAIRIEDNNSTENIAYYCDSDGVQKSITFPYQSIVHGGGLGTSTKTADVNSTFVIINGGKVKSIYGGSRDYGNVGTATIVVNGGTLKEGVQGGGAAASAGMVSTVGIANITFNGGSSLATYGGGMGRATVGTVNMTVNGGTHQWVTAGGSNGTTGIAYVTVNGGNITCLQAVNRGIVEEAIITIKGGSITNVYGGGETGDSSVNGKCEKTVFHIENSFSGTLNKGTYGGVEDASRVSGDYITGTITTAEATGCNLTAISVKQDKLVSGTNIKTINGNSLLGSDNLNIRTYQAFPSTWTTYGDLETVVDSMISDPTYAKEGMAYLGGIEGPCTPFGYGNVECTVTFMTDDLIVLSVSSSNIYPYHWEYNSYSGDNKWKAFMIYDNLPSDFETSTYTMKFVNGELTWIKES